MNIKWKKIISVILLLVIILFFANKYFSARFPKNTSIIWGVSFSPDYAYYLGLDIKETYKYILDDLKFRNVRLTARWDEVEKEKDIYNFSDLDYLVNEAGKRGAKVVLAVGQKTPRWPECNVPTWAQNFSDEEYFSALNSYIKKTVERYAGNSALEIWQVENEPFFPFGTSCRSLNSAKLAAEIFAVKNSDAKHLVLVTDSGELSPWIRTIKAADLFGTTAYRVVWNKYMGYLAYDWIPAWYYPLRVSIWGSSLDRSFISELQAEPWMPDMPIIEQNIAEQMKSMDLARLQKNVDFAQNTGFSRAYLWGAEWWYWLKLHGHSEFSNYIQNLIK